jgi:predicted RNA binding protein YcfA (HicA-like mRNA interferase family)
MVVVASPPTHTIALPIGTTTEPGNVVGGQRTTTVAFRKESLLSRASHIILWHCRPAGRNWVQFWHPRSDIGGGFLHKTIKKASGYRIGQLTSVLERLGWHISVQAGAHMLEIHYTRC